MKNIYFISIILLCIIFIILLQIFKINNDIDNKYILYQCIIYTVGFIILFIFSINNIINKRNNLATLFIMLNSIFLLIYYNNIYVYNSSINIYLKNLPFLNTNFYNSYSKECGKIIHIKRVGEKYNAPCIYITNHSRKNPLNLIYCGALMNENLKIIIDSNTTNFYNSFNEVKGCINIFSKTKNKYNYVKELLIDQVLNKSFSVIVFPNTNDEDVIKINNKYEISKIKSGVFKIAKELNIPIKILVVKWPSILDNKTFLPEPETTLEIVYSDKVVNLDNIDTCIKECKEEFIRVLSQ